jgi:hypothetical protein
MSRKKKSVDPTTSIPAYHADEEVLRPPCVCGSTLRRVVEPVGLVHVRLACVGCSATWVAPGIYVRAPKPPPQAKCDGACTECPSWTSCGGEQDPALRGAA